MDGIKKKKKKYMKKNKKQKSTSITLPHDIIENILSRLPVKYLLRFKSVSKQWNSTISHPRFAQIHLQQSKMSSSRNLLAWEEASDYEGFHVAKLQNNKFRFVSAIEHPWQEHLAKLSYGIMCYCDGLYLKQCTNHNDKQTYLLWNPSTRTYKIIHCPYPIDDENNVLYGICYDPLMKDYKVVIGDMKHYAVFFCRNNKWSEVKEMEDFSCGDGSYCEDGVSFNGSFYWILSTQRIDEVDEFEIISFDWRDEKLKKVPKPDYKVKAGDLFHLASFGGHLCLFVMNYLHHKMRIMKNIVKGDDEEDSWMEFKVLKRLPFHCLHVGGPIFSVNENEVILDIDSTLIYQLYDKNKNTFAKIERSPYRKYSDPVPYLENLFLL